MPTLYDFIFSISVSSDLILSFYLLDSLIMVLCSLSFYLTSLSFSSRSLSFFLYDSSNCDFYLSLPAFLRLSTRSCSSYCISYWNYWIFLWYSFFIASRRFCDIALWESFIAFKRVSLSFKLSSKLTIYYSWNSS